MKYPDIKVQLSGEDGNAFFIIGTVKKALKLNVNLGECTMFKFNIVRERIGSRVWIDANGTHLWLIKETTK